MTSPSDNVARALEETREQRRSLLTSEQRAKLEELTRAHHPHQVTPASAPVISPEVRNPEETPAEHIRNAATIVALCNKGLEGSLVLAPQDAEALRSRLRAALAKLEGR